MRENPLGGSSLHGLHCCNGFAKSELILSQSALQIPNHLCEKDGDIAEELAGVSETATVQGKLGCITMTLKYPRGN